MNIEHLSDGRNGVDEHGDVVSLYDLKEEDITYLDDDLEATYPVSVESSIRNHPSAQDMSDPEVSQLAKGIIDELRQQHKSRRKARAIFAVLRNREHLTSEDRSAVAIEAGLSADVFDEQSEDKQPAAQGYKANEGSRGYEKRDSDYADWGKLAANDRD